MRNRNANLTLLIVVFFLMVAVCRRWQEPAKKELVNREPKMLILSSKVKCLMQCYGLANDGPEKILQNGIIIFNLSSRNNKPCPIYTIQGTADHKRNFRLVILQCSDSTRVIDLYSMKDKQNCSCQ